MSAHASLSANSDKSAEIRRTAEVKEGETLSEVANSLSSTNTSAIQDIEREFIPAAATDLSALLAPVDYKSSEIWRDHQFLRGRLETIEEKMPDLNLGDWSEVSAIRAELEAVATSLQTVEAQHRMGQWSEPLNNPNEALQAEAHLRQQLEALREQVAQQYEAAWQRLEAARPLSPEEVQELEAARQRLAEERQQLEDARQRLAEECQQWEAERRRWQGERQQVEAERQRWAEERRQVKAERQQLEAARRDSRDERYKADEAQRRLETEHEQWEKERQRLEAERRLAVDRSRPGQGQVQARPSQQGCLPGWARWLNRRS